MTALLVIQATVLHKEQYRKYQAAVQPLIEASGARLKASGVGLERLREGAAKIDVWAVPGS